MTVTLKKRSLGSRGIDISELGFGAGGFWGMEIFDEGLARDLVDVAIDNGVNFFDTGPNYSGANAEARLGKILGSRSSNLLIGTKCGTHFLNGRHVKDFSAPALQRSLAGSLRNLRRDYVDLLQLHGMPPRLDDEIAGFLLGAKKRGETRTLGVSTDVRGAERALDSGIFDVVMIEYNVIRRTSPEAVIEQCAAEGVGVMVKSPLAQTLYSNEIFKIRKLSDIWYFLRALKNHRGKFIAGRKYRFLNEFDSASSHDLALQYVLSNQNVSCAIIGTTSQHHLRGNFAAASRDIPLHVKQRIQSVS